MSQFSVIIPTLQKSVRLLPLVQSYCLHPLVGEVVIVNNASQPLQFRHPKVRVLQQRQNIFVNPAWNLGAREARFPFLLISNDDLTIDTRMLDAAARLLRLPVGMIGPARSSIRRPRKTLPWVFPVYRRTPGFGTLMFMRAVSYVPIPEDLLIWSGDRWLFDHQTQRNVVLGGFRIETEMETTSGRREFNAIKHQDATTYHQNYLTKTYSNRFPLGTFLTVVVDKTFHHLKSFRAIFRMTLRKAQGRWRHSLPTRIR